MVLLYVDMLKIVTYYVGQLRQMTFENFLLYQAQLLSRLKQSGRKMKTICIQQ